MKGAIMKGAIMKGGEENKMSSVQNFTSTRIPSPKPSVAYENPQNAYKNPQNASANISSPKSASRLLSVPATAATAISTATMVIKPTKISSVIRYVIIFIILGILALGLYLYLEKPAGKSITDLFKKNNQAQAKQAQAQAQAQQAQAQAQQAQAQQAQTQAQAKQAQAPTQAQPATQVLQQSLDQKAIVNNIDNSSSTKSIQPSKYKSKPVVVPEAVDDSSTKMNPKSKSGYCYIGEDRGFRSCIEVGEGDICMSGDIFPSEAICINPTLRE
jgi:hypothetical protein